MQVRNTIVAVLTALFLSPLAMAEIPGSSSGGTTSPDTYFDYRIEIQEIQTGAYFLKYNTHAPIEHLSQINIKRKSFNSQTEAEDFIAAHPGYTIIDRGFGVPAENRWFKIDTVGTYSQAVAKEAQLKADNGYRLRVRIVPYLNYSYGFGFGSPFYPGP